MINQFFRGISQENFLNILEKSTSANYLDELANKACHRIKLTSPLEVENKQSQGKDYKKLQLLQEINKQLEKENLVSLTYEARIIKPKILAPNDPNIDLTESDSDSKPPKHSSSIVGRRYNSEAQQCEYLLRNSWGRSCQQYRDPSKCEEGNIWLSREDLLEGMHEIQYIK